MKKVLLIAALIGSVNGEEISLASWDDIVNNSSRTGSLNEIVNGESFTYNNVYTLKSGFNYRLTNSGNINIADNVKLIIPEGVTLTKTGKDIRARSENIVIGIEINGTFNNNSTAWIAAYNSGSKINFTGSGDFISLKGSQIYAQGVDTKINFAMSGTFMNEGEIHPYGTNSSIVLSGPGTIINKGNICTKESEVNIVFSDVTLVLRKGVNIDAMFSLNENSSIIGSGTIDMSDLINSDLEGIDIPSSVFNSDTPFTGTIKLPYNTKCKNFDLTNATSATILVPVLILEGMVLDGNKIAKGTKVNKLASEEFSKLNIKLPNDYDSFDTYDVHLNIPFTIPNIIKSEYNVAGNYVVTDELDDSLYEIPEGEEDVVNFSIKGETSLDLRGKGKITFKGDNSEYSMSQNPIIRFEGEKAVFPRDAVYERMELAGGAVIPEGIMIVAKNPQDLSNVTVKGSLII